jgi:hypothetical protein
MVFVKPELAELENESDVEHKFVYPILVSEIPYGLGLAKSSIQTKKNVRRFVIDKGPKSKSYFPDFLVVIGGFPLVVVEVKAPNSNLDNAFREARLYASELNAVYPHAVNPLAKILVTDGLYLWAGDSDSAQPSFMLGQEEFEPYSQSFADLQNFVGASALQKDYQRLCLLIKPSIMKKPRRLLGGLSIQHEEVGHNSFGATISAEFAHIFNPQTREDRALIARHGYVASKRRERYVEPIDRVVRASVPWAHTDSKLIEDTGSPSEIVKSLKRGKQLEHQVLLIIGSVGAGKTTFVDRLQEVSLPEELRTRTLWVHINMNVAPVSQVEVFNWLRQEIVKGCRGAYPDLDFDELDTMMAVYSVEVNKFKKGIGKLLSNNKSAYNAKLAETVASCESDYHKSALCHARFCANERGKLLVIVLDNCDKRTRDEQLLMFEVAQWLRKEFKALVILPLREETYDNHRDQPPLDTALKDLVFRIEPPLFHNVLIRRVQLALDALDKGGTKSRRFKLPNGFQVEYSASDQAFFLAAIVKSIFQYDYQIRRLIVGLSGKNLRRALEIFLEFCNSGYIGEDLILKIIQSEGDYVLPLDVVVTVLVRMNRRFYDSDHSYVKNMFAADAKDSRINYFTRLIILRWLRIRFPEVGPTGLKGYFRIGDLCNELAAYGAEDKAIKREVEYLAKASCVITEDFRTEQLADGDLIRLAPAGFVHLELLGNANYVAAVAEDTWFSNERIAKAIADRIQTIRDQASPENIVLNAEDLLKYLEAERGVGQLVSGSIVAQNNYLTLTDISDATNAVDKLRNSFDEGGWLDFQRRHPRGTLCFATIVNIRHFGVFAEVEPGFSGLIHTSKLPWNFHECDKFGLGEAIPVEIIQVMAAKRKIKLAYKAIS